jgi:low affinity Fe/Cu permease
MINRIVCALTTAMASKAGMIVVPLICVALASILSETELTLALSIAAISITQLVLRSGDNDTRAIQTKLDALIRVSDAPDDVAGIEHRGL